MKPATALKLKSLFVSPASPKRIEEAPAVSWLVLAVGLIAWGPGLFGFGKLSELSMLAYLPNPAWVDESRAWLAFPFGIYCVLALATWLTRDKAYAIVALLMPVGGLAVSVFSEFIGMGSSLR